MTYARLYFPTNFTDTQWRELSSLVDARVIREDCPDEGHWNFTILKPEAVPTWLMTAFV